MRCVFFCFIGPYGKGGWLKYQFRLCFITVDALML